MRCSMPTVSTAAAALRCWTVLDGYQEWHGAMSPGLSDGATADIRRALTTVTSRHDPAVTGIHISEG